MHQQQPFSETIIMRYDSYMATQRTVIKIYCFILNKEREREIFGYRFQFSNMYILYIDIEYNEYIEYDILCSML